MTESPYFATESARIGVETGGARTRSQLAGHLTTEARSTQPKGPSMADQESTEPAEQELFLIEVTFKSGAKTQFECSELETSRSALNNALSIEWTTPAGVFPKLIKIELDDVVAIVRLR